MNLPQKVYIALGSNQGDKFKHLQDAIDNIHLITGNIINISKVYNSKASGFQGDDFYTRARLIKGGVVKSTFDLLCEFSKGFF